MTYQAPASRIVTPFFTKNLSVTEETITDKFYDRITEWLFDNHNIDCDGASWRFLDSTKRAYVLLKNGDSKKAYVLLKNGDSKKAYVLLKNGDCLTFDVSPCYDTEDKHIGVYQIEVCVFPKNHPAHQDPWWEYHSCHAECVAGNQGIEILSLTHPDAIKAYLAGWENYINQLGWDWDEGCVSDEEYNQRRQQYTGIKDYYKEQK